MTPSLAVSALVLDSGRLLMVRRDRGPYAGMWSLPGGKVEGGEALVDAVRREVAEETGLEVDVGTLAGLREVLPDDAGAHYVILVFRAAVTRGSLRGGEWVPLSEVGSRPHTPGLVEVLTGAGVL